MSTKGTKLLTNQEAADLLRSVLEREGALLEPVVLPPAFRWPRGRVSGATFRGVDFAGTTFGGGLLRRPEFDRCRFESCQLDGVNARRAAWSRCVLDKVRTGKNLLSTVERCEFNDVRFEGCRLDEISFENCRLVRCRFEKLRSMRMRWTNCDVVDVRMTGDVRELLWDDNTYRGVDLTGLGIGDASFIGKVGGIAFPQRPESFVVPPGAYRAAAADLVGRVSGEFQTELYDLDRIFTTSPMVQGVTSSLFDEHDERELALVVLALYEHRIRNGP
jgi:uncharacterized protein YjbI with pentapeptide repeats